MSDAGMSQDGQLAGAPGGPDLDEGVDAAEPIADVATLSELEADLAAVEHAIDRLDRVTEQGIGGDEAAAEIAVTVPPERFELPAS